MMPDQSEKCSEFPQYPAESEDRCLAANAEISSASSSKDTGTTQCSIWGLNWRFSALLPKPGDRSEDEAETSVSKKPAPRKTAATRLVNRKIVFKTRAPERTDSNEYVLLSSKDFLDFILARSPCPGRSCSNPDGRYVRIEPIHRELKPTVPDSIPPVVFITGGGIYYFWKAGFVSYLSKHFDLSSFVFLGTSAGALASAVACCGLDVGWASRMAIRMAWKDLVWERSYFLAGVLHNLADRWLEYIIPQDVPLESINTRLVLIGYRPSRMRSEGLCRFSSRRDLIDCLLASIHIPFYANGKAFTKARGFNYLDGGFGADTVRTFGEHIDAERMVVIRCSEHDDTKPVTRRECIKKLVPQQLFELMQRGFKYARRLHESGRLQNLQQYETHPPGSHDCNDDPYFDSRKLDDADLDMYIS